MRAATAAAGCRAPQQRSHAAAPHRLPHPPPPTPRSARRQRSRLRAPAVFAQSLDPAPAAKAPGGVAQLLSRALGLQRAGPAASRVLAALLASPTVPIGSYVEAPASALHALDPRVKQLWLLALLLLPGKLALSAKLALAAALAAVTAAALPRRVWAPQLRMLGGLCALLFVFTALGTDSVPPVTQPRFPSGALEALPRLAPAPGAPAYNYVLLALGPLRATRRGVTLAAGTSLLAFSLLQSAHLVLCTTTPEALAAGLSWTLGPLRLCGRHARAAADEAVLALLLSLRFCALVFEHARNLALGLAVRGVRWRELGPMGGVDVVLMLLGRLVAELFAQSAQITDAMLARGYGGPHQAQVALQFAAPLQLRWRDAVALTLLAALLYAASCGVGCK